MHSNAPFSLDELTAALAAVPRGAAIPRLTKSTMTEGHREALRRLFDGFCVMAERVDDDDDDDDDALRNLFDGLLKSGVVDLEGVPRDLFDTFCPEGAWSMLFGNSRPSIDGNTGGTLLLCNGSICLHLTLNLPSYSDEEADGYLHAEAFDAASSARLLARQISASFQPMLISVNSLAECIASVVGGAPDDPVLKMNIFEGLLSLEYDLYRAYRIKLAYLLASGGSPAVATNGIAAPLRRKARRI